MLKLPELLTKCVLLRKFFLFCLFTFLSCNVFSQQNFLWSNGGNGNDEALTNCMDSAGNIYTTGYFSLGAKFDTTVLKSSGSGDVFISRQNAAGDYIWSVNAGGKMADRGYGITADHFGYIYITGFYSDAAQFGSTSLTSNNSSLDIFVAKLDTAGNFIWAKSFGGNDIDMGLGITTDRKGNVIVTGQFRQTAQFGSYSFTSMNDTAGLPSYDIFVMKLDTSGSVLWAKQGAAKFDDRGISVSTDNDLNIYMAGQYSDTLSLGITYPGVARSISFLAKLDSSGNNIWLRQFTAKRVLIYSVICKHNDVYVGGEFAGTLMILSTPPMTASKPYSYEIFVARLDSSGKPKWASCDGSNNQLTGLDMDVDVAGNAYITGTFNCVMTEYSGLYGPAIFNSVGFRDVYITKYDSSGNRKYEKQFGGPGDDYCSAISIINPDKPVIAGSFQKIFNVPSAGNFKLNQTDHDSSANGPAQTSKYCGDLDYNNYISVVSDGNKDIFSTLPIELTRQPYDYYDRSGSACLRNILTPYINQNQDTITGCDSVHLFTTRRTGDDAVIGPEYKYEWYYNNKGGSPYSTVQANTVTQTGWYYLNLSFKDGCRSYSDSIYVIVYLTPPIPIIGYTKGWGKDAIPGCLHKLWVNYPDTAILYVKNVPLGYLVSWNTPSGTIVQDSVPAITTGLYVVTVSTPDGKCSRSECIEVFWCTAPPLPSKPLNLQLHFTNLKFDLSDTVEVCEKDLFAMTLVDSTDWLNGDTITPLKAFVDWTISGGMSFHYYESFPTTFIIHYQRFQADTTGPCTVTAIIEDSLGNPLIIVVRSFYLIAHPLPPKSGQWHGPAYFCPGDTMLLTVTGGTNYSSFGPGIFKISATQDSLWVTQPGIFACAYIVIDSITGCSTLDTIYFDLHQWPAPKVQMFPANGVICPNDSVELIAENGSNYSWWGPLGNGVGLTQSIWVKAPGQYHYNFTNPAGCKTLVSEFVEIKTYTTPDLTADPSPLICNGDSTKLIVTSDSLSLIQWLPPLSGSSTVQTVYTPGTYQCSITSCGITSIASIEVKAYSPPLKITSSGKNFLCTGDTILLMGSGSLASYSWVPGNSNSQFLSITTKGTYELYAWDFNDCPTDTSIFIDSFPRPQPPITSDTTICSGDTVILHASGTGTLTWFDTNGKKANILDTGSVFLPGPISNHDSTFYVASYDSVCYSSPVGVTVRMNPASLSPPITGKKMLCRYDTLVLSGPSYSGISYSWTGPNGFTASTPTITIPQFDSLNIGNYSLQIWDTICTSPVNFANVGIFPSRAIQITGPSAFCPGTFVTLSSQVPLQTYLWQPSGSTSSAITVDSTGSFILTGIDQNGCHDTSQSFSTSLYPVAVPPHATDTNVCEGDSVLLFTSSTGTVSWFDSNMLMLYTGNPYSTGSLLTSTKYYLDQVDLNGCKSKPDSVNVTVKPIPPPPVLTASPGFCLGDPIFIYADTLPGAVYSWSGPNGYSSTAHNVLIPASAYSDSGMYTAFVALNGCGNSDSVSISIIQLPAVTLIAKSPVCIGETFSFSATNIAGAIYSWFGPLGYSSTQQSDSFATTTITQSGFYYLDVIANGCHSGIDSVNLQISDYPSFSLGNDTTICFGKPFTLSVPTGYDAYLWSTGDITPVITVSTAGIISATVMNLPHCNFTDSILVDTIECSFVIPNVFTPNHDGVNDYYYFDYRSARDIHIIIFDRWGKKVQELSGKTSKWDGRNNNGGELSGGVYYFIAEVIDYSGKPEQHKGWIQLIR